MIIMDIDWTKVPIETLIYVRNDNDERWHLRKLAIYVENNELPFGCFGDLSTSGSIVWWKYAKIAEEE